MANETNNRIQQAMSERHKLIKSKGDRDATNRFGVNIPYDLPLNFSAGYFGKRMRDLKDNYEGKD